MSADDIGKDWTHEVADRIESAVSALRDKTAVPATRAVRAVVYGIVAGILLAAAGLVIVIAFMRILDVYLWFGPQGRRVWVADAAAAGVFGVSGSILWRFRRRRSPGQA